MKINTYNSKITNRELDENGFLFVKDNLILCDGIMEYLGEELESEKIGNIPIEKDKIYKLNISKKELEKCLDLWKLKAITNDHHWLSPDNAKKYQIGTVGENLQIKQIDGKNYIACNISINDKEAINLIMNDVKNELSTSYANDLKVADSKDYDFEVVDIIPNHLALVDKGRAGDLVRVSNSFNNIINNNQKTMKTENTIELLIDGKKVDLSKFLAEEKAEGEHDKSISDADNKAKNEDKDKKEEDEQKENKTCNEDKQKVIYDVGGILKGKIDEEVFKTVMEKLKSISFDPSQAKSENKTKNEDKEDKDKKEDEEKDEKVKAQNYDAIYSKIFNSVKDAFEKEQQAKIKAYNTAKNICDEFDYLEMSEKDIYKKALNQLNIDCENEDVAEMKAMIKAYNSAVRVDNSFNYGISENLQEKDFNI